MKVKKLVVELTDRESGVKQVNVAQMTEIVSKIADILAEEMIFVTKGGPTDTYSNLLTLGFERLASRMAVKKKAK
jgi:hypothetical protein